MRATILLVWKELITTKHYTQPSGELSRYNVKKTKKYITFFSPPLNSFKHNHSKHQISQPALNNLNLNPIMPPKKTASKSPTGATQKSDCQIKMDSDAKAWGDKEDTKHTEALAATANEKIYLSEVVGVAVTDAFTSTTLLYDSNAVETLEACRDALVAAKQWIKSAKAALKAAQQMEDMEAISAAKEGLKLATTRA